MERRSDDRLILPELRRGMDYVDLYAPVAKELAAKEAKAAELDEVSPQA